ncbi:MAG TPA: GAF domain-containing protein [Sediminispirochaeta sp.]|nr:GAF domain-containing protein [Sediminispirochaeta sp.]
MPRMNRHPENLPENKNSFFSDGFGSRELSRLQASEYRYRKIFDNLNVSIWEEDYTGVYRLLNEIKDDGEEDLQSYLKGHPETLQRILQEIKILDVNDATLRMYHAPSKEAFLGSLDKIFVDESTDNFIREMVAIADGERFFEGETLGRKLTGEMMDLLLQISVPEKNGRGDYRNVLVAIIDITERKNREREHLHLLQMAESLRKTTLALASTMDRDQILDLILDEIVENTHYSAIALGLKDEQGRIKIFRRRDDGRHQIDQNELERLYNRNDHGILGSLPDSPDPVLIKDTRREDRWIATPANEWVRSFLGMPIVVRGRVIGLIGFCGDRPGMFGTAMITTLEPYVLSAAMALENARLYAEAQHEIAERQAAEEQIQKSLYEKKILLMEIHHRVKNNLSIIASLLNLHGDQIHTVEQARSALQLSQSRVHSMALVHENLYQSKDLARIDIAYYIQRLLDELLALYSMSDTISVHTKVEELYLNVTRAVPFGLLLNELITNALTHAFVGVDGGELKIRFEMKEEEQGYLLVVEDNGVGLPETVNIESSTSLGLQLVRVLTEQLGGDIRVRREKGSCFCISFPIEESPV